VVGYRRTNCGGGPSHGVGRGKALARAGDEPIYDGTLSFPAEGCHPVDGFGPQPEPVLRRCGRGER